VPSESGRSGLTWLDPTSVTQPHTSDGSAHFGAAGGGGGGGGGGGHVTVTATAAPALPVCPESTVV
jgi:hypothetical protein